MQVTGLIERAVPGSLAAGRLQLHGVFGESRPAVDLDAVVVCRQGRPQTQLLAPLREAGRTAADRGCAAPTPRP
jgi:hypothetical protein